MDIWQGGPGGTATILQNHGCLQFNVRPAGVCRRSPNTHGGGNMKKPSGILSMMMLGMFIVLAVGIGNAQYESQILQVQIPFDFNVGRQSFSAGNYTLRQSLQHTMLLRDEQGRVLTSIATNSVESSGVPSSTKLVFNGYGKRYFLNQIWEAGNTTGQEAVRSPVEIEIAKHPPGLTAVNLTY
jgi:hypothetical protein